MLECDEARLVSRTNFLVLPQTIATVLAKSTRSLNTSGIKEQVTSIVTNIFLHIESPLYLIQTMYILPDKKLNTLLLIVNLGHNEVEISKGHTLAYLTPAKYENLSDAEENNQAGEIANISATASEINAEILTAIPQLERSFYPGDYTPVRKVLLQDAKISADTQD